MAINSRLNIHNLVICANIFIRKEGKYLLLKRSHLKKYAPDVVHPIGGKVDNNENPFTAAQREVYEEAGIKVKNMRLEAVILEIQPVINESENWLIFHYSADYKSGSLRKTKEGEFIYLDKNEISKQPLFPSVQPIIHHILNPKDGTVFLTVKYDTKGKIINDSQIIKLCIV